MSRQLVHSLDSRRWVSLAGAVAVLLALALGVVASARASELPQISGKVTAAGTLAPLSGVEVCAYATSAGEAHKCASTEPNGEYVISGLPSGSGYKVEFAAFGPSPEYQPQFYNDKSSSAEAQPVVVAAPSTTSAINAALKPVPPKPPVNKILPKVSGTPAVGATLTCGGALWIVSPGGGSITFQWLRDGAPIPGATTRTYTVEAVDQGHSLACEETERDAGGVGKAISASVAIPAAVIPPPPPPPPPGLKFASSPAKLPVSHGSVTVAIACTGATCRGTGELTMQIVTKHRKGKKTISHKETLVLAKSAYSLAAGKTGTIVLRLTAAGKKRLAHAKHHPVTTKLILFVQGGTTITESVQIR